MRLICSLLCTIMMITGLTACEIAPEAENPQTILEATKTNIVQTHQITETFSPTSLAPQTKSVPQPTSIPAILTSTETSQAVSVCSPLGAHGLGELDEITSQVYDPPPPGKDDRHHGIDFAYYRHGGRTSIEGETVHAILSGRVAASIKDRPPYGNMVILETKQQDIPAELITALALPKGASLYHLYAHLENTPTIELGEGINCGEILGHVGKTGYFVPVPHLHIETRIGPPNVIFESMAFYDTNASEEEMQFYRRWRTSGEFEHFDPMNLFIADLSLMAPEEYQPKRHYWQKR